MNIELRDEGDCQNLYINGEMRVSVSEYYGDIILYDEEDDIPVASTTID